MKLQRVRNNSIEQVGLTVNALLLGYVKFASTYYVDAEREPTSELSEVKYSLRPVRRLCGRIPIHEFGPLALNAVREDMLEQDWCRGTINRRVEWTKLAFRWGVEEELVPADVYQALRAVAGLRYRRCRAREKKHVKRVSRTWVDAVLPCVAPHVAAMIELQWLIGMRPGEVVVMQASA